MYNTYITICKTCVLQFGECCHSFGQTYSENTLRDVMHVARARCCVLPLLTSNKCNKKIVGYYNYHAWITEKHTGVRTGGAGSVVVEQSTVCQRLRYSTACNELANEEDDVLSRSAVAWNPALYPPIAHTCMGCRRNTTPDFRLLLPQLLGCCIK